ncbi:MAG: hypothetical protein U0270_32085 [Labilithrix sp.]
MKVLSAAILATLLGSAMAAAFLLACSGADGDPAPAAVEAGSDSGVVIIVSCADGATE